MPLASNDVKNSYICQCERLLLKMISVLVAIQVTACGSGSSSDPAPASIPPNIQINKWTWVSGSDSTDVAGVYSVLPEGNTKLSPGARSGAASWVDKDGNFWLFGGRGHGANDSQGLLNDFWKFDGTRWQLVSGTGSVNDLAVYGDLKTPADANTPSSRAGAATWTDQQGHLWLFGGDGVSEDGTQKLLNDLWKFDGARWSWMAGSKSGNALGLYGELGSASDAYLPGARFGAAACADDKGRVWLFGGFGNSELQQGQFSNIAYLNDLWKYESGKWAWVAGSKVQTANSNFGIKGERNAGNSPGGRLYSFCWVDQQRKLWLFGGFGVYKTAPIRTDHLNDLWKFDGDSWAWVAGSQQGGATGLYGTKNIANSENYPGARNNGVAWTGKDGHLWLYGGYGKNEANFGQLADLWRFDGSNWTWVSGTKSVNIAPVFGVKGTPGEDNSPGSRSAGARWVDAQGNFWTFGGESNMTSRLHADLWKYEP